ncbi:AI-2E family transporter [Sediminispirochaeta bajacaliforniensis]|uniref:AI-2E family transporter n=1 Tax=Sediminispirochaeta bajacaliforniensis TaxID=148 RepID=UPI000375FFE3|nr:AI-2E family transporter [Sediminispirochaeta bajacaliforniensis]
MKTQNAIVGLLFIIVVVMVGALFKAAGNVLLPLIISVFLSFIIAPFINFLNRIHVPRFIAISIVVLFLFGVMFLIFLFIQTSVNSFIAEFPKYAERFRLITRELFRNVENRFGLSYEELLGQINWNSALRGSLVKVSGNLMNFISTFLIVMIFLIFLLLEKPYFKKKLKMAFEEKTGKKVGDMIEHINHQVARYLSLKFFLSLATGIAVWFALKIIGLDFAVVWGTLAFLLNFIPSIGSSFHMIVTILMGIIQFYPSPGKIFAVALSMIGIQAVIGQFLDPRLQGHRLNLSPFIILVSLVLWGWIWGIVGMFLAVPITVIIQIICQNVPGLRFIAVFISSGKGDPEISEDQLFALYDGEDMGE